MPQSRHGGPTGLNNGQNRGAYLLDIIFNIVKKVSADALKDFVDGESIPRMVDEDVTIILKVLTKLTAVDLGLQPLCHLQIHPPASNPEADIRYFHVAELDNQYSIGIFFLPPGSKMPLHDHPYMCVFSRILTGSLLLTSMDWMDMNTEPCTRVISREARITQKINLVAPHTLYLTPDMFNLHMMEAGEEGCAFLDILIPPYKEGNEYRDCTYYSVTNPSSEDGTFGLILCDPPLSFNVVHGTLDL